MQPYTDRGVRALVLLHEQELTAFVGLWRRAKAHGVTPPASDDPDYASLETLLRHVLRAARGYMVWLAKTLELPDPEIRATPQADAIEAEADAYLAHLLERWRLPLVGVEHARLDVDAKSTWGVVYSVDGMLEHAVMHPIRHGFQVEAWLRDI